MIIEDKRGGGRDGGGDDCIGSGTIPLRGVLWNGRVVDFPSVDIFCSREVPFLVSALLFYFIFNFLKKGEKEGVITLLPDFVTSPLLPPFVEKLYIQ